MQKDELRKQIIDLVGRYYKEAFPTKKFIANETFIPYSGRVFDEKEIQNAVDASLDFWLTGGRFTAEFEERLAEYIGVKYCTFVNSGSSANLLVVSCLTSEELGDRRLKAGDEVITTACGFPTTLNPIIQNNLVPVCVDIDLNTYNLNYAKLRLALSPKTKAIFIAHTLGNLFLVKAISNFAYEHKLWLIEDACDGLGGEYLGMKVGSFGDISTQSFYPAHIVSCGEGGAVLTDNPLLDKLIRSFNNWGKDCSCLSGQDNQCGKRFSQQFGDLPFGYDHKFVFSHIGYNLQPTDIQASILVAQMDKLSYFVKRRIENYNYLYDNLNGLKEFSFMQVVGEPCYFGFPLLIKTDKFNRVQMAQYLESHKIQTRMMFGGNLLKQPAYKNIKYRQIGNLENTDNVMNNLLWIGVYPALTKPMLDYMVQVIKEFVNEHDK